MNLKRLRGIATVALITIAAALFAGCSNSMAGSVDGDSNARMATLSLSATGIPNDYAEQFAKSYPTAATVASRSITPNAPYQVTDDESLTFKLSGKSETGKVLSDTQVYLKATSDTTVVDGKTITIYNFYSDATGSSDVVLDAMSWNLNLVAYNAAGAAVLQGFCSVDLRTGSGTAKFTMGTEGLTDEGSVKITGTFVDKDDAAASYSMGIYRKDTGLPLLNIKTDSCKVAAGGDEGFEFKENGTVAPGTYLYTMIFYADAGCTGNIVGSFTDTLVVDPGNALVRELKIDVIGKKPVAPTELKAYLVNGSEGKNGSPTYNVKVEWGKSLYATNYELQVLEYKDVDADTTYKLDYDSTTKDLDTASTSLWTPTIYGMRSMDPETNDTQAVKDFAGSAVYGTEAGVSYMMFGDTSCNLLLETGKIYEIRLRGRNYIGVSEFVEREASADDAANKLTGFGVNTTGKNDHINRLLVTYHLNGGELISIGTGDDNSDETFGNIYAEYKSWTKTFADTATNTALAENGASYTIKNGTSAFDSWLFEKGEGLQDDGEGNMTTINAATTNASKQKVTNFTYKNLTVLASYGNKVTGNISMGAALKDIDLNDITVSFTDGAPTETPLGTDADVKLTKYTITKVADAGNGSTNILTIMLAETNGGPYKDVSFTLTDSQNKQKTLPVVTGTNRTCNIDLTNYPVGGTIQVMISAVTNKTTTVSRTLLFDLQ